MSCASTTSLIIYTLKLYLHFYNGIVVEVFLWNSVPLFVRFACALTRPNVMCVCVLERVYVSVIQFFSVQLDLKWIGIENVLCARYVSRATDRVRACDRHSKRQIVHVRTSKVNADTNFVNAKRRSMVGFFSFILACIYTVMVDVCCAFPFYSSAKRNYQFRCVACDAYTTQCLYAFSFITFSINSTNFLNH